MRVTSKPRTTTKRCKKRSLTGQNSTTITTGQYESYPNTLTQLPTSAKLKYRWRIRKQVCQSPRKGRGRMPSCLRRSLICRMAWKPDSLFWEGERMPPKKLQLRGSTFRWNLRSMRMLPRSLRWRPYCCHAKTRNDSTKATALLVARHHKMFRFLGLMLFLLVNVDNEELAR